MTLHPASCLIGVDGGGTACRIALLSGGRRAEVRTGPANVHTDPDQAVATLLDGLAAAVEAAGLSRGALAGATGFFGLAGVTGPAVARAIAARLPLARVEVGEDCLPTIVGALGDSDGAVAGIGTGSFFGRQAGGRVDLRGGWGFVLGDEASGAWLGRGLLSRVLHVRDGLAPATALTEATLDGFPDRTEGLMVFAASARPADYAAFAPKVVAAAVEGDAAALELMRAGAAHVVRALEALGWRAPEPVCLTGGVAQSYVPYLPPPLTNALAAPRATALDGALTLAARLAAGGPS